MQEKYLIGFVIYNNYNQFLLTKTNYNNMLDYGLVSEALEGELSAPILNNILYKHLGVELKISTNNACILMQGLDTEGKYIIIGLNLNISTKYLHNINNEKTQFMWLPLDKIKILFDEKRLNTDQLQCICKCCEWIKSSKVKSKISTTKPKTAHSRLESNKQPYANPEIEYSEYVDKFTDRRLLARLINRRKVKPCGRECHEYGFLIAQGWHHSSFENFTELMNDEEFILAAAEITPNPVECGNYFYMYVNEYLKAKSEFKLRFLKAVYLNLNVYNLEDINLIVEELGLQAENEIILNDFEFKGKIEGKFERVLKKFELAYHCSGADKKELHRYKVKANELKVLLENIKKGLTEIINSFKVGNSVDEPECKPNSFYEFLCAQAFKNKPKTENDI